MLSPCRTRATPTQDNQTKPPLLHLRPVPGNAALARPAADNFRHDVNDDDVNNDRRRMLHTDAPVFNLVLVRTPTSNSMRAYADLQRALADALAPIRADIRSIRDDLAPFTRHLSHTPNDSCTEPVVPPPQQNTVPATDGPHNTDKNDGHHRNDATQLSFLRPDLEDAFAAVDETLSKFKDLPHSPTPQPTSHVHTKSDLSTTSSDNDDIDSVTPDDVAAPRPDSSVHVNWPFVEYILRTLQGCEDNVINNIVPSLFHNVPSFLAINTANLPRKDGLDNIRIIEWTGDICSVT